MRSTFGRYVPYDHPSFEEFSVLRIPLRLRETLPPPRYNVAPGTDILLIRQRSADALYGEVLHWGLIPSRVKDRAAWKALINVRAESIDTKPALRSAFKRWRCLVPANGFYEWQRVGAHPKAPRHPYDIHTNDARHFAFAGTVERWQGARRSCTRARS